MSCDKGAQVVSIYFFENGVVCAPERVRKRRCELDKLICRKGKFFLYRGKNVYTFKGDPLCSFDPMCMPQTAGFVLVAACENYQCRNYEEAFQKILCQKKAQRSCKSMPAVNAVSDYCPSEPLCPPSPSIKESSCAPCRAQPSSCAPCRAQPSSCVPCRAPQKTRPPSSCMQSSEEDTMESRVTTPAPCGQNPCAQSRRNNFPSQPPPCARRPSFNKPCPKPPVQKCPKPGCVLEASDSCNECPRVPNINYKCKSRKPPTPFELRRKTGFMARCCPCCVGEYECAKAKIRPPTTGCTPNAKNTQTDKKDFTIAKKHLQQALKEERQRQGQFQRRRKNKPCAQRKDICPPPDEEECVDPKVQMKREKAREKYCLQRRKMEQKLTKTLEKTYKKECN